MQYIPLSWKERLNIKNVETVEEFWKSEKYKLANGHIETSFSKEYFYFFPLFLKGLNFILYR